jgi:hypothetical protein
MPARLKGVGPEIVAGLWSEGLFDNRRQLAAYAGRAGPGCSPGWRVNGAHKCGRF